MKRHSIKKASTFKLQAQRSKFQTYLDDIQNCEVVKKYPHLIENIKQTSQTVFSYCYTFREDSPFLKGLNYGSKSIGFSFQDNVLHYKEWLPNINAAYIMGQFNTFNTNSHKLQKCQQEGMNWFKIQIDLSGSHIQDDGSKFMLRVIDHQGTQFYMIPPSCHIISNGYGIVKKAQILPPSKKKLKINQLLAYTIDLKKISLKECIQFLTKEAQVLQAYNTIILKNFFKNNYGLMYKYSMELNEVQLLRQIVLKIKQQCSCKAVIQWNFQPGNTQYSSNPIQQQFLTKLEQDQYRFDLTKNQVMAYYLANASYFYQNIGIDGIHFTNIEHALKTKEGQILLRCLNVLNFRIIDSGITLGSSKNHVQGLTGQIIEGGCGFNFTYNHHQAVALSSDHNKLFENMQKIADRSNCLAINFDQYDQSHMLNLIFTILLSKKGVFTRGDFDKIRLNLKKVLKLRCQDKLFDNEISNIKFMHNDEVILIQRGVSIILFNFSCKENEVQIQNCEKMQIIFTHNSDDTQIQQSKVKAPAMSCILFENQINEL